MWQYSATLLKTHDGDTVTVSIDVGVRVHVSPQKIRLIGINAPEMSVDAGPPARTHLLGLLGTVDDPSGGPDAVVQKTVYLNTIAQPSGDLLDNYGRLLAWLYLAAAPMEAKDRKASLNWQMYNDGFARGYLFPKDWPS